MTADDDRSSVSGWTAPNVDAALPSVASPGPEWQAVPAAPVSHSPVPTSPQHVGQHPGGTRFPSLPGVDLPTQLPEPQPAPEAGLAAHKPGAAPLRPLGFLDIVSGAVNVARGNTAALAVVWVCVWVPVVAAVVLARLVDDGVGTLAQCIAALVVPVLLTGALAAPMHAAAIGRPMPFRGALSTGLSSAGVALALIGAVLLAAPAILTGLALAALTSGALQSVLIMALPVLYAISVTMYLLLAAPVQMALVVVGVEGGPLLPAISRALYLTGRGLGRQVVSTALQALIYGTIGFAILVVARFFFGASPLALLITAAVVSPTVAGFAVMSYVDVRIRLEAYDVTLLAGQTR